MQHGAINEPSEFFRGATATRRNSNGGGTAGSGSACDGAACDGTALSSIGLGAVHCRCDDASKICRVLMCQYHQYQCMTCKKPDVSYLFHSQRRWKFHQNWNIEGCRPWTAFRREAALLLSGRFLRCFKNLQNVSKIFKGCVSGCFRTRKAPVVGYQGPGIPGIGIGGAGRSPNGAALPIRCSQTSA